MAPNSKDSTEHTSNGDWDSEELVEQHTTQHSLSQAVYARRSEYTRPTKIKIKVGTWNVAACKGVQKDIGDWFVEGKGVDTKLSGLSIQDDDGRSLKIESVESQEARKSKKQSTLPKNDPGIIPGGTDIGLYVLGLQEVVELASAKEYMSRIYTDPEPLNKWKKSMAEALPQGYELVSEQQLSGLVLLVYASPEISPSITSISMQSVGTGVMGYLGNKGGLSVRIVLGETTRMVFVNSHLASGTDPAHLDRRCWDVAQILSRTKFDPISRGGVLDDHQEEIGDEDFAFWFGDLNFRLEGLPGEDIRRLLMLHTRGEYGNTNSKSHFKIDSELSKSDEPIVIRSVDSDDESGTSTPQTKRSSKDSDMTDDTSLPDPDDFVQDPHSDPESLQATLDSLLPHDQLAKVRRQKMAFHDGWREGPITFLPTYRYDVGSMGMFDSSEKKRTPSWCDRILFRTRRDKQEHDGKTQDEALARIKDEEMRARGIDHARDEEDVLFDYDPESDGADDETPKDYDEYEDNADVDETNPPETLTKEGFVDRIHLDMYTSHQRVLSSDHKPVDAVFTLHYDAVVPELKSKIQAEVARELDRAENEGRPTITVVVDHSQEVDHIAIPPGAVQSPATEEAEGVYFGDVRFMRRCRRGLTIANTGQVSAKFCFIGRPSGPDEEQSISPEWLTVGLIGSGNEDSEEEALKLNKELSLEPGDAINVSLEVFVDNLDLVRSLNSGTKSLDDVLVLRVNEGRDHFVPVRASWLQSCFGGTVDELVRVPEGGVRALVQRRKGDPSSGLVNRGEEVRWSAPRELLKLIEAVELLVERSLADNDMIDDLHLPTDEIGWPFEPSTWKAKNPLVREVRKGYLLEALDCDKGLIESFPPEVAAYEKLEIVAETLVMFLSSISDGIITSTLWTGLDEDMKTREKDSTTTADEEKTWILDFLASEPHHNISLVFLTTMLGKVAGELAPVSGPEVRTPTKKLNFGPRRSLSFKGKAAPIDDPRLLKRQAIHRKYAEIFAPVVCRGAESATKEKEKKIIEEKQRRMIEVFLDGFMEQQVA